MKRVILFLLLFLVSCSGSRLEEDSVANPFTGGVEGLRMSVLEGAPPKIINDQGKFPFMIAVALENVGEADVGPGTVNSFALVRVGGVKPSDFGVSRQDLVKRLGQKLSRARRNFDGTVLPGEVTTITFEGLSFQPRIYGSELFTFNLQLCYDYYTFSALKICLKDDIAEHLQDDSLCTLRSDILPQNSGGPLRVVSAKQTPVGNDKVQVNFVVQNLGSGVFFNRLDDSDYACDFNLDNPDIYKALVVVAPLQHSDYSVSCPTLRGDKAGFEQVSVPPGAAFGVLKFRDNAPRPVTCFITRTGPSKGRVFQDVLEVRTYYRYGEFLDVPVLIQELGS